MRGVFRAVGRGAAGNDVEFRAFLDDDEVVHVCPTPFPLMKRQDWTGSVIFTPLRTRMK